jgi:hypothetical protein
MPSFSFLEYSGDKWIKHDGPNFGKYIDSFLWGTKEETIIAVILEEGHWRTLWGFNPKDGSFKKIFVFGESISRSTTSKFYPIQMTQDNHSILLLPKSSDEAVIIQKGNKATEVHSFSASEKEKAASSVSSLNPSDYVVSGEDILRFRTFTADISIKKL